MRHNPNDVGLQLDKENTLVASDDEDEPSETTSSSFDGSEEDGIDLANKYINYDFVLHVDM